MTDWLDQYGDMVAASNSWPGYHASRRLTPRTIYCISEGSGLPAKIGLSEEPRKRFSLIASHTWRPLFLCWTADGSRLHEAGLKFVTRDRVLRGEWLNDTDDMIKSALPHNASEGDLRALVNRLAAQFDVSPTKPARQPRKPSVEMPKLSFGRRAS